MTDLEINKALALAIGWGQVAIVCEATWVNVGTTSDWLNNWRVFDYRDWAVIGPIAAKYNCFPFLLIDGSWKVFNRAEGLYGNEETPQKAIAMAVIEAKP